MSDLAKALALVYHDLANADLLLGLAIDRCEDPEWDYRKGIMAEMREEARRLSETAKALFDKAHEEEGR